MTTTVKAQHLQRLLHHDFEGKALRYFDAIAWLDHKIARQAKKENR